MARVREMQRNLMKLLLKSKFQWSPLNVGDPRIINCPLRKVEDRGKLNQKGYSIYCRQWKWVYKATWILSSSDDFAMRS